MFSYDNMLMNDNDYCFQNLIVIEGVDSIVR